MKIAMHVPSFYDQHSIVKNNTGISPSPSYYLKEMMTFNEHPISNI